MSRRTTRASVVLLRLMMMLLLAVGTLFPSMAAAEFFGGEYRKGDKGAPKTPPPTQFPTTSPRPTRSPAPTKAPTPPPTFYPTPSPTTKAPTPPPTLYPTPSPSAFPTQQPTTLSPSSAPSVSFAPSVSAAPTDTAYDRIAEPTDGSGGVAYLTRCGETLSDISVEPAGPASSQVIAYRYRMTVAAGVEHASKILTVEAALNGYLSRRYLGDCAYTNSGVQVLSLSSLPNDVTGAACESGVSNCRLMDGFVTAQVFYKAGGRRRRSLQETTLTDPVLTESFGSALGTFFRNNSTTLRDTEISSLEFDAITNFAVSGQATFDGVDPNSGGGSTTSAGISSDNSPADNGQNTYSWGAAILGMAVVALAVTALVAFSVRRRRRAEKAVALPQPFAAAAAATRNVNDRYTYDDANEDGDGGMRVDDDDDASGAIPPDDGGVPDGFVEAHYGSEERERRVFVLDDDFDDASSNVEVIGWNSNSLLHKNPNPPVFVSTHLDRSMDDLHRRPGERYDPYNSRSYSTTPDTVDM